MGWSDRTGGITATAPAGSWMTRLVLLGVGVVLLVAASACGGDDTTTRDEAEPSTTTIDAEPPPAELGDPGDDPDSVGVVATVGESDIDPGLEVLDACSLLDAAAVRAAIGAVGDPVELEDGAACGLEADNGARVAVGLVRSEATPFLTTSESDRAEHLTEPDGARWVVHAPVDESDLLVVPAAPAVELVVEVSAAGLDEAERRDLAVTVASGAIDRLPGELAP